MNSNFKGLFEVYRLPGIRFWPRSCLDFRSGGRSGLMDRMDGRRTGMLTGL